MEITYILTVIISISVPVKRKIITIYFLVQERRKHKLKVQPLPRNSRGDKENIFPQNVSREHARTI